MAFGLRNASPLLSSGLLSGKQRLGILRPRNNESVTLWVGRVAANMCVGKDDGESTDFPKRR